MCAEKCAECAPSLCALYTEGVSIINAFCVCGRRNYQSYSSIVHQSDFCQHNPNFFHPSCFPGFVERGRSRIWTKTMVADYMHYIRGVRGRGVTLSKVIYLFLRECAWNKNPGIRQPAWLMATFYAWNLDKGWGRGKKHWSLRIKPICAEVADVLKGGRVRGVERVDMGGERGSRGWRVGDFR